MESERAQSAPPARPAGRSVRRWVRRGFLVWAVVSLGWLANSVRTQGVPAELLLSSPEVSLVEGPAALELRPRARSGGAALLFLCGSGIHPHAYLPLLRPLAEAGYPVIVVGLPYRFAPLPAHKHEAVERARRLMSDHAEVSRWIVAGHSLGGALAARVARAEPARDAAYVLIGTTHPRAEDLSRLAAPFTKVYASRDGIAPVERILATRHLLPEHTRWIEIEGGNHSQFGHYGRQLFDGTASLGREAQQATTREALLEALERANAAPRAGQ